jgi:catechol 2,3-dioxygenase-like lactoylglutathione lyase family enzyme
MLHQLSFGTADLARSTAFYDAVLAALGYARVWADDTAVGYGYPGAGDKLAIKLRSGAIAVPGPGFHVAFAASDRDAVARFYKAALEHGGDNGPPGLRPQARTITPRLCSTPDGYAIEAVTMPGRSRTRTIAW